MPTICSAIWTVTASAIRSGATTSSAAITPAAYATSAFAAAAGSDPAGSTTGSPSAGIAIATGHASDAETIAATLSRLSPATAPATSVSGVGREAVPSASRPFADFRPSSNARARCTDAAPPARMGQPPGHAVVVRADSESPRPGIPFG